MLTNTTDTRRKHLIHLVSLAALTAIVLVLQLLGVGIKLPFLATPVSLVLVPIVLGAIILGKWAGAWLGFVFGMVVFITCGVLGQDPMFTAILFQNHPILTFLTCTVKSTVAGFVAGWVYEILSRKNTLIATFVASALVPILNTLIFMLGCFTMMDTFRENFLGGMNMLYFLVVICAGVNFLFELAVNMIFAPAIHRIGVVVIRKFSK